MKSLILCNLQTFASLVNSCLMPVTTCVLNSPSACIEINSMTNVNSALLSTDYWGGKMNLCEVGETCNIRERNEKCVEPC